MSSFSAFTYRSKILFHFVGKEAMTFTISINETSLDDMQAVAIYVAIQGLLDSLEFHTEFPIEGEDGITSYDLKQSCSEVAAMLQ